MNKKFVNVVSRFLTVLLLFTLGSPSFAAGQNTSTIPQTFASSQLTTEKISPKLNDEFDSKEYVTYLIKLSEQPNTMSISKTALNRYHAQNVTPRTAILNTRSVVVNSLREASTRTQASLLNYLEGKKESGDVKDYKSFYIVNAMAITSTKAVMEEIAKRPEVANILPNETIKLDDNQSTENVKSTNETKLKETTSKGENKNLTSDDPVDPNVQWNINQIDAPKAWKMGIDGTGVVIGSLDTGVDYTAPAIQRKWRGFDNNGKLSNPELSWYDPTPAHTNLPYDGVGHGTHTMGTMVGSEKDGTHKIGVAPGAKWMSARIFDSSGSTTTEIILDAGQWMLAPKDANGNLHPELAPDVINNSWGGAGMDEFFRPIVQAWKAAGIVPVFSAGNTNTPYKAQPGTVANPANYPESFAVGATDKSNNLADFSLRGPSPYGEIKPDVSAPGVGVLSSMTGGYITMNGTSMAGPHVAGIVALMLQANASLTVDQIENIIKQTAKPMTNDDYGSIPNNGYGYGIVNAYNAVKAINTGLGTVSGKVTTSGKDLEKPVIDYTPIKLAFTNADIPLHVSVNDNISVISVKAFVRKTGEQDWTSISLTQMSGDYKHGIYEGAIPSSLVTTPGLDYYFQATDYGNNQVTTGPDTITIMNGLTPGYFQDFEQNFDGFSTDGVNNTWQWGEPTTGPNEAFSGKKVVGTNLTGTYSPDSKADLLFPTIDLTNSPRGAILSFEQWYDFARDKDMGTILVSADSTNNEYVPLDNMTGTNGKWETKFIDLSQFAGQLVHVKLELTSDDNGQNTGWFIDDVSLYSDQTAPSAPSNVTGYANPLGKITLKWDASKDNDVNTYKVYRSTTQGSDYEFIGGTPATTFEDTDTSSSSGPYYYVVTAQDLSVNESGYSNEATVNLVTNPKVIYSDNFDGPDDNGWTHSGKNDEWERGVPQNGPGIANSSPNVWGTDLVGNYEDNSDYSLYSPVIDLSKTLHPVVTFQNWYELEGSFWKGPVDIGEFEISTDGGNSWAPIDSFSSLTDGKTWSQAGYDLEEYKGQQVQFRFHLTSNESKNYAGWYMDDFKILDDNDNNSANNAAPNKTVTLTDTKITSKVNSNNEFSNIAANSPKEEIKGNTVDDIPLNATVTILETGQSVIADGRNGDFRLSANPGNYTVRAEAYGYYPENQQITINDNETTNADFNLKPLPHGVIQGVIIDQYTGKPVSNARVMVMEDARVSPVFTDSNGNYTLDVLEGDYTLTVSSQGYYDQKVNISVTGGNTTKSNLELKPFVGLSGELAYDDGSAESTSPFDYAGTLQAVRMTPEASNVQVTGAKFLFYPSFPQPGGTDFKFAMFDASGPKGSPGKMVAGPFEGTALRNGDWTTVQFDQPIIAQGDFYIAFIQTASYPYSPSVAEDTDGPDAGRSWINFDGGWRKAYGSEGNIMIRALVKDEVNAPVITSPANKTFTKESHVNFTGTSNANGTSINLYNGSTFVGTGKVENGQFSIPTTLNVGSNVFTVKADAEGNETESSEPVNVTLDQKAPDVNVTDPIDGYKTNKDVVTVNGSVSDDNQGSLTINDQSVKVKNDGTFSYPVVVTPGENTITIKATDLAGNETVVTRKVIVNQEGPVLSNITPDQDVHLQAGEQVHVSFDSDAGLTAGFRIELPIGVNSSNANGISMNETKPGHYEGTWTIPDGLKVSGAAIVVYATDKVGNNVEAKTSGRLFAGEQPPSVNITNLTLSPNNNVSFQRPVTIIANASQTINWNVKVVDPSGMEIPLETQKGKSYNGVFTPNIFAENGTYKVVAAGTTDQGITAPPFEATFTVYNYQTIINSVQILNSKGIEANTFKVGETVKVKANVENLGPTSVSPLVIIQVKNAIGIPVQLGFLTLDEFSNGAKNGFGLNLNNLPAGSYNVDAFVWSGWDSQVPLSEAKIGAAQFTISNN
ncbi:MAG: S8 family serine peptidase [Bacillota bacterium]|nr:S8 family serine peptidase [Bacillota bacterium]